MPPVRVPGTDRIIFVNDHIGDIELNMKDYPEVDAAIRNEDVRVVGNWEDYHSTGNKPAQEVMMQGISDVQPESLKGQVEQSELNLTNRGHNASTTRTRPKLVYMEL